MLDILINKNKEPVKNMEYVYLFHMAWIEGRLESLPIKYGTIVHNVKKQKNDSLTFNIVGDDTLYFCNYGWAFAENTPKNNKKIKLYLETENELKKLDRLTKKLRDEIVDLNGPSKI